MAEISISIIIKINRKIIYELKLDLIITITELLP